MNPPSSQNMQWLAVLVLGLVLGFLVAGPNWTTQASQDQSQNSPIIVPNATGGPDGFGYRFIDSDTPGGPAFSFTDISGTGTTTLTEGDDVSTTVPLPFPFTFYGVTYNNVEIHTNGYLDFEGGSGGGSSNEPDCPIPTPGTPNASVYAMWSDLVNADPCDRLPGRFVPNQGVCSTALFGPSIRYQTLGVAPNRTFIVQWTNNTFFDNGCDYVTFQIRLTEGNTAVDVAYCNTGTSGLSDFSTAGIESHTSLAPTQTGLLYTCNSSGFRGLIQEESAHIAPNPLLGTPLHNGLQVRYYLSAVGQGLGTLYVADTNNNRIQTTTDSGLTWVGLGNNYLPGGTRQGDFKLPEAVASNGSVIYVADTGNNRIQKSVDGGTTWTTFAFPAILSPTTDTTVVRSPNGVVVAASGGANADVYVSDTGNGRVIRYVGGANSAATNQIMAASGIGTSQVRNPQGLAIDTNNTLYIADTGGSKILRVTAPGNGVPVATLGDGTPKVTNVRNPQGVAIDPRGDLYIADTGNNRVLRFPGAAPAGAQIVIIGPGTVLGQVQSPEGVTVTNFTSGPLTGSAVIVSDTMNNRIQGSLTPTVAGSWQALCTVGTANGKVRGPSKIR